MVNVLLCAHPELLLILFGYLAPKDMSSDWPGRRVCLVFHILLYTAYNDHTWVCTPNSGAKLCSVPISQQPQGYATEP